MEANRPDPKGIVTRAKKLLAAGKTSQAQDLLLNEGYVKRLEPVIQKAYLQLIPVGPTLAKMLAEAYQDLDDPSAIVRFKAVTKIAREFNKEHLRDHVVWMRDPRASEPLIKAVGDSDAKVSERALGTLSRLVCQYFIDQRTMPVFRAKLADVRQEIRTFAISGIACLRREELLKHLIDLMDRGTDKDRSDISSQIWGLAFEASHPVKQDPIGWSAAGRRFWTDKMIAALRDSFVNVRKHAARALKELGDRAAIPALQAARKIESDEDTAFYMDDAIAALKESA